LRLCIFCGSQTGRNPEFLSATHELAELLVARRIGVVYGGGRIGLMGHLADRVIALGGEIIGVIPQALEEREAAHRGLSELRVVGSMHTRKALMAELSAGFIALPGGFGTLEELCEAVTWVQLGIQQKPCGLVNTAGYFDPLIAMFDQAVRSGFISPANRSIALSAPTPAALLNALLPACSIL
jgi:uncharacterized protein (TIGR00730 family)